LEKNNKKEPLHPKKKKKEREGQKSKERGGKMLKRVGNRKGWRRDIQRQQGVTWKKSQH